MKANELMLGDWVHTPKGDFRITAIQDNDVVFTDYADDIDGAVDIEYIEPIPITPEILEKNGFTRYGQVYANLQQWVGKFGYKRKALVQDIRTGEWGTNDVWINYIHEFQHVLKLCRIDKTIEL